MPDITQLILDHHAWFRQQFAELDYLRAATSPDVDSIQAVWAPLTNVLDVHALAEEQIFYPQLLRKGEDDPEAETLDAIGDHNDIRDGLHDAARHPVASVAWWDAVSRARRANDAHMAEEEHEGLSDFRRHAPVGLREALGRQYTEFFERHPTTAGLDVADKDPESYVRTIEQAIDPVGHPAGSLAIGSLRGRP